MRSKPQCLLKEKTLYLNSLQTYKLVQLKTLCNMLCFKILSQFFALSSDFWYFKWKLRVTLLKLRKQLRKYKKIKVVSTKCLKAARLLFQEFILTSLTNYIILFSKSWVILFILFIPSEPNRPYIYSFIHKCWRFFKHKEINTQHI